MKPEKIITFTFLVVFLVFFLFMPFGGWRGYTIGHNKEAHTLCQVRFCYEPGVTVDVSSTNPSANSGTYCFCEKHLSQLENAIKTENGLPAILYDGSVVAGIAAGVYLTYCLVQTYRGRFLFFIGAFLATVALNVLPWIAEFFR